MEQAKEELKRLINELFVQDLRNKADELLTGMATQFQGAVDDFTDDYQNLVNNTATQIIEPKINSLKENIEKINTSFTENHNKVITEFESIKTELNGIITALQYENSSLLNKISESSTQVINDIINTLSAQGKKNDMQYTQTIKLSNKILSQNQEIAEKLVSSSKVINGKIDNVISDNTDCKKSIKESINQTKTDITDRLVDYNSSSISLHELTIKGLTDEMQKIKNEFDKKSNFLLEQINETKQYFSAKTEKITRHNYILLAISIIETIIIVFIYLK